MARIFRLVAPPKTSGVNPVTVNGRVYNVNAGSTVDAEEMDAVVLRQNQWTPLGMVGATSARPAAADPDFLNWLQPGFVFVDTTLGKGVIYDKVTGAYRDLVTGAAV